MSKRTGRDSSKTKLVKGANAAVVRYAGSGESTPSEVEKDVTVVSDVWD